MHQYTLAQTVIIKGVGVHSGRQASVTLRPADVDYGIVFCHLPSGVKQRASVQAVCSTEMCTTLKFPNQQTVMTIEHLLAALYGLGVTNAQIDIDGPEIPIMDGSSQPFIMNIMNSGGIVPQHRTQKILKIRQPVRMSLDAHRWIEITPYPGLKADVSVTLTTEIMQNFTYAHDHQSFKRIAMARTFCNLRFVEQLKEKGLIQGGSLDNALVLDNGRAVNPEGFRVDNECARHKTLDLLGDLSLAPAPIYGFIRAKNPGHTLNIQFLRKILSIPEAWSLSNAASLKTVTPSYTTCCMTAQQLAS